MNKIKGQIPIGIISAATASIIAIASIIYGFGAKLATIEGNAENTHTIAAEAKMKAETALEISNKVKTDVEWIRRSLEDNGIKPKFSVKK